MNQKQKAGLVGLFVLFMLLLNVPFISIPRGNSGGIPYLMFYFGVIWLILILVMGVIYNYRKKIKE